MTVVDSSFERNRMRWLLPGLMALGVAVINALPHLMIPLYLKGESYTPLVWRNVDDISYDETFYAIPIRQILTGDLLPGDSQLWEHRQALAAFGVLPYWLYAVLAKMSGGLENAFILGDVIFPATMVILIYLFAQKLASPITALALAVTVVLGSYQLFVLPGYGLNLSAWLNRFMPATNRYPLGYYVRFPSMQLVGPLFMASLLVLTELLKDAQRRWLVLSALLIAASFYSYFHLYTLWPAILISLLALIGRRKNVNVGKRLVWLGIGVAGLIVPFVWQFILFRASPYYLNFAARLGWSHETNFSLDIFFLFVTVLAAWRLRFAPTLERQVVFASLLGMMLVSTQQYFTGVGLFPYHYYLIAGLPLSAVVSADVLTTLADRFQRRRLSAFAASAAILLIGAWATLYVLGYAELFATRFALPAATRRAFAFLQNQTLPNSVVGSFSLETATLLSVHTHNSVLIPNTCPMCTVATDDEIIERVSVMGAILDLSERWFDEPFSQDRWLPFVFPEKDRLAFEQQVWGFTLFFYRFFYQPVQPAPPEFMAQIRTRYQWWQQQPRNELYEAFCLNYIWSDAYEQSVGTVDLAKERAITLIYTDADVTLYRVNQPSCH